MTPPKDPPRGSAANRSAAWRQTARDWVTIWQSELAALADDSETLETWQGLVDAWSRMAEAMIAATPEPGSDYRIPGPAAPAGAAPAAAAPDPRAAELARLAGRVAELEWRLAGLEPR